ncbi:hypothetical protein [Burkholderia cenocepacia]|uniref:hypothetical protein n=1 Tax=Burkholderia cenocepacia TaxID=95486 RepID=UPI0011785C8F|nr:hypothetical protein [Burkholderia cenocepacia]
MTATKKRKTEKRHVKHASTTGTDQKSLVKAVVQNDSGEWVRPSTGDKFVIDETPKFPEITFEIKTEQPPPYQWKWTITWDAQVSGLREKPRGKKLKTFSDTGSFSINDKTWVADPGGEDLGREIGRRGHSGYGAIPTHRIYRGHQPEQGRCPGVPEDPEGCRRL